MVLKEIGINTRIYVDSVQCRDYWRALVNEELDLRDSLTMRLVYIQINCRFYTTCIVTIKLLYFLGIVRHLKIDFWYTRSIVLVTGFVVIHLFL